MTLLKPVLRIQRLVYYWCLYPMSFRLTNKLPANDLSMEKKKYLDSCIFKTVPDATFSTTRCIENEHHKKY